MQHEQLQKQHVDGLQSESYKSIFQAAAVKNVIPDPDVPLGFDANSSEYNQFPPHKEKIKRKN